jgi:hypothetical protein
MLNLFGKVSFDASGFTQAMSKMKASAGPAGAQIGQQIRGKMLEAFGAGAAIALFKQSIQRALEVKSGATKLGVGSDQFQALDAVAKAAGMSVDELAKSIEKGGPAADELASAVESARIEMEQTGQLINSETIDNLAALGDKFSQLAGKLAPGLAMLVDWASRIYGFIGRGVTAAVSGGQIVAGQLRGDQAQVQAGRELAREAFSPSGQASSETAVRTAATIAARIAREESSDKEPSGKSAGKAAGRTEVSSLVAAGAIFGGQANTPNRTLEVMNNEVKRIRAIIEKGRD